MQDETSANSHQPRIATDGHTPSTRLASKTAKRPQTSGLRDKAGSREMAQHPITALYCAGRAAGLQVLSDNDFHELFL
ncbi:uncharacterized protein ColSpa_09607 [Colletotrichum spaethianum]|uniref:Uncharacterized protein n=1 Tax=Colletotrichum spaethianum TaxID=700344 RepID=A0AA37UK53_9PEZI|nr:uncharacterized protein ColSpa_09607 [Colletotrichum spaethianum]GKT49426.1 hypothetical protein ColSpa_09607 [Colletotrichum spaethianum]